MRLLQISYATVSEQRGQKRIWLEGGRLAKAGFSYGEGYTTTLDMDRRMLVLECNFMGDKQVSGRKRRGAEHHTPIVDICNADIAELVGTGGRVRVAFYPGRLEITLHHEELDRTLREERTLEAIRAGTLTTGTLCAGAGISTAAVHDGLRRGGLQAVCEWIVDVNGRYLEIADVNNHAVNDATRLVVGSIEELHDDDLTAVDVLNVSLPCNIHSRSGKSKRQLEIAEEDGSITSVFGLLKVVKATKPSIVISENVVEARDSAAYLMIRAELERLGYRLSERTLNADDAGTVENRERYWLIAVSKGLPAIQLDDLVPEQKAFARVGDLIEDTEEARGAFRTYAYLDEKEKRDIAAGKGFRQQIVSPDATRVGTVGRGYMRVRSTEPRLAGPDGTTRLFSVREHMRLKNIPEHLLQGCLPTIGHEAAGQSILYGHGVAIGNLAAQSLR